MKGYRTILINVLAFFGYALAWEDITQFIDPQYIALGHAVVNFGLRYITNTPVGGGGE